MRARSRRPCVSARARRQPRGRRRSGRGRARPARHSRAGRPPPAPSGEGRGARASPRSAPARRRPPKPPPPRGRVDGSRSAGSGETRTGRASAIRPVAPLERPCASTDTRSRRTRGSAAHRDRPGRGRPPDPTAAPHRQVNTEAAQLTGADGRQRRPGHPTGATRARRAHDGCHHNYLSRKETVMTTTTATPTSQAIDAGIGLREGFAEVGDVQLHYVEAGDGPLVLLLHGFPEFWYGWRQQIAPLVEAGFRVVAPDLRGYNLSSKPDGFDDYTADKMATDVRRLIRELGAESAMVVGHDWGGSVAWTLAMNHPEVVDRLVILNAAHPRKLNEGLRNPRQLLRTWSFFCSRSRSCPAPCAPQALAVLQALPARRPAAVNAGGDRSLRRGVVPARVSQ